MKSPVHKKNEHIVFFTSLVALGIIVVLGAFYFITREKPDTILSNVGTITQPQSQMNNIETVPTSTIVAVTPTSSTSIPPLVLPYSFNASTANQTYWPKAWSEVSFTSGTIALIPDPIHHGANTFLAGASSWSNYAVNATASPLDGGWFDIIARVASDTQDFVYCEFGTNGTEIIERVNGNDTQLAFTAASTTDVAGASEEFGMKIYGNDIGCMMQGQEVVGATVTDGNESSRGGIGFVIFGAPPGQKQVEISNISAWALPEDDITVPFPIAVAAPSPVVTPPLQTLPPPPVPSSTPEAVVATTTKTLPYDIDTFNQNQGWNIYWGNFSVATDSLTMAASTDGTSAGVLLDGTNSWDNYVFTATLDWVKGETFGLYARYTDAQNYVLCYYDEPYLGQIDISLEQHINGTEYTLATGEIMNFDQWGGSNITAGIRVFNTQGACYFNNNVVSSAETGYTINPPYSGDVGFTTWDPAKNNTELIVKSIDVEEAVN
jgi:hypothetical protein